MSLINKKGHHVLSTSNGSMTDLTADPDTLICTCLLCMLGGKVW